MDTNREEGKMNWEYDDGGRKHDGFKGTARDCLARAVSIATEIPYWAVYSGINDVAMHERPRVGRPRSSARGGVHSATIRRYIASLGWAWHPTMGIGTGCKVHLRAGEVPMEGRIIVRCSRHITAVVDGVIRDTHDPSRGGTRCVYGYWDRGPTA
jgi:hypothetical protein